MVLVEAQHGVDLAHVAGFDEAVDFLQGRDGPVGVKLGEQNGQGRAGPALNEFADFLRRAQAAGEQHARDVRLGRGQA